ncbi:MAG: hypothetical protein Q8M26_02905 [Pseudolabrys sp.]|nr:hypothetical protein [Pseudolabrys sp.]
MTWSSQLRMAALVAVLLPVSAQPALALDQDDLDSLSRHGGATFEAFSKFGDIGETLTHVSSGKFEGTGSQKRAMAGRFSRAMAPVRGASQATKNSLSYKVLPHAFMASDIVTSIIAPAIEGDYRGAMGSAVNIGAAPTLTGAGASVFGAIGTGIGATVGSFIPVVGTAGGAMVGGAIGTVAGGYICAAAYDIYVKEWVGKGVEGGIAGMFDVAPQQQAMRTRHEFLYAQAADDLKPHWDRLRAAGFGSGGVELIGPESTPYISIPKPPLPDPQQQAALPPVGPSSVNGDIEIVLWDSGYPDYRVRAECRISSGEMRCEGSKTDPNLLLTYRFDGHIDGSVAIGQFSEVIETRLQGCAQRYAISFQMRYDFDDAGQMRGTASAGTQTLLSNSCPYAVPPSKATPAHTVVGTWKAR